ncbi:MAG: PmoA family protein [Candidatus Hydrogenedentota bacterium]
MNRTTAIARGIVGTILIAAALAVGSVAGGEGLPVEAHIEADQLVVTVDGEEFAAYRFAGDQKYPFMYPVNGPASGESVTTWDTEPFPHHSSLYFACDRVNNANFWQPFDNLETGQIRSQGAAIVEAPEDRVVFTDEALWAVPGDEPMIQDERRITVTAPAENQRFIDWEITLTALEDVRVEQNNHSLFSARMTPALTVEEGGTLIDAEGNRGEEETFGEQASWAAYYGTRDGVTEGLAILQHPDNPDYPAPWFTRDYGFFSPTPVYWLEEGYAELPEGESLMLRYRVVIFAGDHEEADIAGLWADYAGE